MTSCLRRAARHVRDEKLIATLAAIAEMREEVRSMGQLTAAQYQLVAELESRGNVMPHTFVIVPEIRDKIPATASMTTKLKNYVLKKKDKLTGFFLENSRLHFFCPVTRRRVPCGPDGRGYVICVPSKLLKALMPALRIGLVFLKVALASQGMGGLVPVDMNPAVFRGKAELESVMNQMNAEFSSIDIDLVAADTDLRALTEQLAEWESSADAKLKGAYSTVFRLIAEVEGHPGGVSDRSWRPTMTGLYLEQAPAGGGNSLWVSPEGRTAFKTARL
jgi:hypothetical protein